MADKAIFDAAQFHHERQHLPDDHHLDGVDLIPASKPRKTAQQKAAENLDRQRRGDRQDWRGNIRPGRGSGYRLADEWTLTKEQKARRTQSIKAAIEKREGRQPVKVPTYQRGERRAVYAKLTEKERGRKAESEALTLYGPYDLLSGSDTRSWEIELRKAVHWFVYTIGGPEPDHEKPWRERREAGSDFSDAHFGFDPADGWDWGYQAPDRDEMDPADFHKARRWCSPDLPPRLVRAMIEAKTKAEGGYQRWDR